MEYKVMNERVRQASELDRANTYSELELNNLTTKKSTTAPHVHCPLATCCQSKQTKVLTGTVLILILSLTFVFQYASNDPKSENVEVKARAGNIYETHRDDCAQGGNCLNGGTCIDGTNSFTCSCTTEYNGYKCQTPTCPATQKATLSTLSVVNLGCGGLVPIPKFPALTSFLLDYKSNETFKREEQCLWTLDNTNNGNNYAMHVTVTLLCEAVLDAGRAVSFIHWDGNLILNTNELTRNSLTFKTEETSAYKLFLSYTAADVFGPGFLVKIEINQANVYAQGSNFAFTTAPGRGTYGPYRNLDMFSITLNPQQPNTTFSLDYLDSPSNQCGIYDTIDVYEVTFQNVHRKIVSWCGKLDNKKITSRHPMLATFWTSTATRGRGFGISWK